MTDVARPSSGEARVCAAVALSESKPPPAPPAEMPATT